jgi:hypothetical protein
MNYDFSPADMLRWNRKAFLLARLVPKDWETKVGARANAGRFTSALTTFLTGKICDFSIWLIKVFNHRSFGGSSYRLRAHQFNHYYLNYPFIRPEKAFAGLIKLQCL